MGAILLLLFIPIACVNYYPINYLFGRSDNLLYLFSPLMSIIPLVLSIITFNRCIKHYEGTGS